MHMEEKERMTFSAMLVLFLFKDLQLLGADEFKRSKINEGEFGLMTCQSVAASKWPDL